MAAVIAISPVQGDPAGGVSVAAAKEQLLMERGEQYKRAIQVYFATTAVSANHGRSIETS